MKDNVVSDIAELDASNQLGGNGMRSVDVNGKIHRYGGRLCGQS